MDGEGGGWWTTQTNREHFFLLRETAGERAILGFLVYQLIRLGGKFRNVQGCTKWIAPRIMHFSHLFGLHFICITFALHLHFA